MAMYHASIMLDGWVRLAVNAANRSDAASKVRTARIRFALLDDAGCVIAEIVDGEHAGECDSMFILDLEEVETVHQMKPSPYHDSRPPPDLLDDDDEE